MRLGAFLFGNYGWLGKYRADSILSAAKKVNPRLELDPTVALDVFHSCYLLNTALVPDPPSYVSICEPILTDESLREITVADDLASRVFAVKFILALAEEVKQMAAGTDAQKAASKALAKALAGGFGREGLDDQAASAASKAVERAKATAKAAAERAKAYAGIRAGVGHDVTFGELLDLNFTVDVRRLLRMFRGISADFERTEPTNFGAYEGVRLGRDLSKLTPSAIALPEELFWYRYATSTLPQVDTKARNVEDFVLVVDKSGSMAAGDKTLWSRAVALALARLAKRGRVRAKLFWFDYEPFGGRDLVSDFDAALREILTLRCTGGTSIDAALRRVDGMARTIVLITDGEDEVSYKPRSRLISCMVQGDNRTLALVSSSYLRVRPDRGGALRLLRRVIG